MFKEYEWWEILGLLYASINWQNEQIKAQQEARRQAEIEQKLKDGKLKMYYRKKGT